MEDQSPRPEDQESKAVNREDGELRIPHAQDNIDEQLRRLEKWQFRKSWQKFFGDIANKEEVQDSYSLHSDQLELIDDKTIKWSSELKVAPELTNTPIEKLYELRQEVKDAPTLVKGAASVGKVMAEALEQRKANLPTQLATSESLHRTAQKWSSPQPFDSLYRRAILYGLAAGVVVATLIITAIIKF